MEGEVEVEVIVYLSKRAITRVKLPISELKRDDEGSYSYDEIEAKAYLKAREEFRSDGFSVELSESELVSHPEGFEYWI